MQRVRETLPVTTCRAWRAIFLLAALAVASQAPLASAQMGEGTEGRQWVAGPQQSKASPAQYQVIEQTNQYMQVRVPGSLTTSTCRSRRGPSPAC